jgi:hypothetical protein
MGRAPCCDKVGLKRGRWTAEEDQILANYIAEHGEGSWRSLPKNAGKPFASYRGVGATHASSLTSSIWQLRSTLFVVLS